MEEVPQIELVPNKEYYIANEDSRLYKDAIIERIHEDPFFSRYPSKRKGTFIKYLANSRGPRQVLYFENVIYYFIQPDSNHQYCLNLNFDKYTITKKNIAEPETAKLIPEPYNKKPIDNEEIINNINSFIPNEEYYIRQRFVDIGSPIKIKGRFLGLRNNCLLFNNVKIYPSEGYRTAIRVDEPNRFYQPNVGKYILSTILKEKTRGAFGDDALSVVNFLDKKERLGGYRKRKSRKSRRKRSRRRKSRKN